MERVGKKITALGSAYLGALILSLSLSLSLSPPSACHRQGMVCALPMELGLSHRGTDQLWRCSAGKFHSGMKEQKTHSGHRFKQHPSSQLLSLIKYVCIYIYFFFNSTVLISVLLSQVISNSGGVGQGC